MVMCVGKGSRQGTRGVSPVGEPAAVGHQEVRVVAGDFHESAAVAHGCQLELQVIRCQLIPLHPPLWLQRWYEVPQITCRIVLSVNSGLSVIPGIRSSKMTCSTMASVNNKTSKVPLMWVPLSHDVQ